MKKVLLFLFNIIIITPLFAQEQIKFFMDEPIYTEDIIHKYNNLLDILQYNELLNIENVIDDNGDKLYKKPSIYINTFDFNNNKYVIFVYNTIFYCGSGGCLTIIYNITKNKYLFNDYTFGNAVLKDNKITFDDLNVMIELEQEYILP